MTLTLTPDAQLHLDRYLKRAKAALRGRSAIDAEEVERDVLGHIDAELAGQPQPIGADRLLNVLERLGAPDDWVEEDPQWRRVVARLRSGPEDWRLAYLTFGSLFVGVGLFMSIGLWPLPPLLIALSVLLARVTLSLLDEHDEPVGARRWLIYPPLAAFYVGLAGVLIAWPVPFFVNALVDSPEIGPIEAIDLPGLLHGLFHGPSWVVDSAATAFVLGGWWLIAGLVASRFVEAPRLVFWPFADWFKRRHAASLAVGGVLLAAVSAAILIKFRP